MKNWIVPVIGCLVWLLSMSLSDCANAQQEANPPGGVVLTEQESSWLEKHRVLRVAPDPDFPPFEFFDASGEYRGIAADYVKLIEDKLGVTIQVVRLSNWDEVLEKARDREVDILAAAAESPQRREYLNFTQPHIRLPGIILANTESSEKLSLDDLDGKKVAVVSGYVWQDRLSNEHPEIELVPVPDIATGLQMTSFGIVDAMVGDQATTSYHMQLEGLTNLRVAGRLSQDYNLAIAYRNDWPELGSILEKALAAITEEEKAAIRDRWISLEQPSLLSSREFWLGVGAVVLVAFLLVAAILGWNRMLKRQVAQRTEELNAELIRRHEVEEELRQHRDHLDDLVRTRTGELEAANGELRLQSAALESAANAILISDADGTTQWVNRAFSSLTHFDRSEVIGKNPRILKSDQHDAKFYQTLWETITAGNIWRGEIINRRKDGSLYTEEMTITPVLDDDDKITHFIAIKQDISARKQAEQEILRAREAAEEANLAKSAFLANMSHEIRTPMNGIMGMTDLALDTELTVEQREYLALAKSSAESLLALLNDILDFSKIEAGKLELDPVDFGLRNRVGDTLNTLAVRAHTKSVELAYYADPNVPDALIGDVHRLRQIVVNLVGNAIKFTEKGEVVVRVAVETLGEDHVDLRFSVSDTGIGIPADKLDRIFSPFEQADTSTTRRFGGTGLGLAISAQLVELMQGRMWVESQLGKGTTFFLTARFGLGKEVKPTANVDRDRLAKLPILVVDDNYTNRRILEEMLKAWDLQPVTVDGGEQALRALDHAQNVGRPLALIISDVNMPEMDGFGLAERVRRHPAHGDTPIIFLTSADRGGEKARCEALRISAHLMKPVKPSTLLDAIASACGACVVGKPEKAATTAPDSAADKGHTGLKILLAEDNAVNQKFAVRVLQKRGHDVTVASNGKKAVATWERETFDVILMDVQMPEMDGFEATATIREKEKASSKHSPIIAMTAHAMKGDRERCLEAGMDGYVTKPVKASTLMAEIERVLESRDSAAED